jgi:hypothetical protein
MPPLKPLSSSLCPTLRRADAGEDDDAAAAAAAAAEADSGRDAFRPEAGNVAFGSAHDGWAFTAVQFAEMYAEKLGCRPEALRRCLWGDWAFSAKEKRVVRIKRRGAAGTGGAKPMFVQFALEPIWKARGPRCCCCCCVAGGRRPRAARSLARSLALPLFAHGPQAYTACDPGADVAAILAPIVKGRGLGQVTPKALAGDARQALRSVLRAWLPLSEAVLGMATEHLPSPAAAAPSRVPKLLGGKPGALAGRRWPPARKRPSQRRRGLLPSSRRRYELIATRLLPHAPIAQGRAGRACRRRRPRSCARWSCPSRPPPPRPTRRWSSTSQK